VIFQSSPLIFTSYCIDLNALFNCLSQCNCQSTALHVVTDIVLSYV
ncbi:unnamed protein product, partial [Schistosoma margrebowiei]